MRRAPFLFILTTWGAAAGLGAASIGLLFGHLLPVVASTLITVFAGWLIFVGYMASRPTDRDEAVDKLVQAVQELATSMPGARLKVTLEADNVVGPDGTRRVVMAGELVDPPAR